MNAAANKVREPSARHLTPINIPILRSFDVLASAPNGISALRQLILRLAVQGRLAEQDDCDEPAHLQLARISTAKSRSIAGNKVNRDKAPNGFLDSISKLPLPRGWASARLSQLVAVLNGRAYSKQEFLETGTPVLRVGNLFTSKQWYFSNLVLEEEKYCNPGDLLFAWSASFGPFIWEGPRAIYHYHIWKLSLYSEADLYKNFLYTFLLEKTQEMKASGHGVSMIHMTKDAMEKIVVPVPPLAEQRRIVARVEELMKLCDALEQTDRLAYEQHTRLTSTLFEALAGSDSTEAVRKHSQRLWQYFDVISDRPASINDLEATILHLAVRGNLSPVARDAQEWLGCRLGDVVNFLNGYAFKSEWFRSSGVPVVRNINVGHGNLDWTHRACVDQSVADELARFELHEGDIILTLDRPIISSGLKYAVVSSHDLPCLLLQRVAKLEPRSGVLAPKYLELWLRSNAFIHNIDPGRSNGVPHISTRQIATLPFLLPPYQEQLRLVSWAMKVSELFAQLRERLELARESHVLAADVLMASAQVDQGDRHTQ